ncbi:hypothetical protein BKA80DRAFT_277375 [Phyllosticta citrichinensis]
MSLTSGGGQVITRSGRAFLRGVRSTSLQRQRVSSMTARTASLIPQNLQPLGALICHMTFLHMPTTQSTQSQTPFSTHLLTSATYKNPPGDLPDTPLSISHRLLSIQGPNVQCKHTCAGNDTAKLYYCLPRGQSTVEQALEPQSCCRVGRHGHKRRGEEICSTVCQQR